MKPSIDCLLDREYDEDRYNCRHFAGEAWELLTGDSRLREVNERGLKPGATAALFRGFRRVEGPTAEPSIVLMDNLQGEPHVGICYRRRMLHLNHEGPQFVLMDAVHPLYKNLRFWA